MSLFIGRGLRRWPGAASMSALRWICTAPVLRHPSYPVVVDLIESLMALDGVSTQALEGVVSPRWAFYRRQAAESNFRVIHYREIWVAESDAEERFLIDCVCRLIGGLGDSCGVIFRDPHRYDPMSIRLTRRLIREGQARGFVVGLDAPVACLRAGVLADLLEAATVVETTVEADGDRAVFDPPFVHSVPASVFSEVTGARYGDGWSTVEGPVGIQYVSNPGPIGADRTDASSLRSRLLAAWSPEAWGYLRRGLTLSELGDPASFHAQHSAYIFGMSVLSRDFLFQYLRCALANRTLWNRMPGDDLHVRVAAARLATRVATDSGFAQAELIYQSCLEYDLHPVDLVEVLFELANSLAVQKKPAALLRARRWYREAFSALARINDAEKRLRWRVQLLNGLALVEYHSHEDRRALRLEHRARIAVNANSDRFAYVAAWARRLLNLNTAKLLSVRLGDINHSREMLHENVRESRELDMERTHAQLASLLYDQGDYAGVLRLLEPLLGNGRWRGCDLTEEFFCRSIYILALRAVSRTDDYSRELAKLGVACERRDAVKALGFVNQLRALDDLQDSNLRPFN
jgi:hypothetical protein